MDIKHKIWAVLLLPGLSYASPKTSDRLELAAAAMQQGIRAERAGDFQLAYNYFLDSRQLDPSDPDVHNNMVILATKLLDVKAAAAALQEFRRCFPSDTRAPNLQTLVDQVRVLLAEPDANIAEMKNAIRHIYLLSKQRRDHEP